MATDVTTALSSSLSVREQAALTTGASFWQTVEAGGVPPATMTDGPHGLRKQYAGEDNLGIGGSEPATCFPPAVSLGQSWDVDLAERIGAAIGDEAQAAGVNIVLGPGINIKRDPRCGRNFEYLSEDPLLTGALGTAFVEGMQSRGVGTSLKHFALNNQEHDRMRISSDVDERTMHEIYLNAFERVVRTARPWTVMCSYNRINGVLASQNRWLLTELLRDSWGFDGVVISDWGAVSDKVSAVRAGLDLQMPGTDKGAEDELVSAVESGALDPAALEAASSRVIELAKRADHGRRADATVDFDVHHQLARRAAAGAIVLLKNDGDILPLTDAGAIAVIGDFAMKPRFQGGGSSHVNPTRVDIPFDEIVRAAPGATVTYARGFAPSEADSIALRDEASQLAASSNVAVVFLGLTDRQESEGFDRDHIDLPADQIELLSAVLRVQPNTVVVLSHGGVVRLGEIVTAAPAILDGALLGQAGGGAIADVLFGRTNPSGRLAETVPQRLEDTPAWLSFPGERGSVRYGEGVFVGYRWYDARDMSVTFPFGHGLSYTSFAYSDLVVDSGDDAVTVRLTVTNRGSRAGRDVVQVYAGLDGSAVARPTRELKGFALTTTLEPGASETVEVHVSRRDLAIWDVRAHDWKVEAGTYRIEVGASSRDIRLSADASVVGDEVFVPLTLESTFSEVLADPIAGPSFMAKMGMSTTATASSADVEDMGMDVERMSASIPVGRYLGQGTMGVTKADVEAILAEANRR